MRLDFNTIEPTEMSWTEEGNASILWSDGHRSTYTPRHLRKICPCATCRGTHGTVPQAYNVLGPKLKQNVERQIIIKKVEPMGHYAIAFTWGDGHREGIYTWPFLRDECPCDGCEVRRELEEQGRS